MADEQLIEDGWDGLVKIALLGTARLAGRPQEDRSDEGFRRAGLAGLLLEVRPGPARSLERTVLANAAALAVARKAARSPLTAPGLPAPAPVLDGRPVPAELAAMVPVLLADRNRPVLVEVLERCADLDLRFPAAMLPAVLDLGTAGSGATDLQRVLHAAAGARGRWLAERNPRWSWLRPAPSLPADLGSAWDLGSADERLSLLRAVRATEPGRAPDLLRRTWKADRAPDRAMFLGTLLVGLSMADEPFLEEHGIGDRAKDVRQTAWRLLGRLPGSRRSRRMAERVDSVLQLTYDADAVPEVPASWASDGVVGRPHSNLLLVTQLIEATPLDHWGDDIGAAILRVAAPSSAVIMDDLFDALARAAVAQRRDDWIMGLLEVSGRGHRARAMLRAAPIPAGAVWLAGVLAKASVLDATVHMELAHAVPRPWPAALVAEVMRRGVDIISHERHLPGDVSPHLHLVGERADGSLLARLVPDLAAIRAHSVRLERAFRDAHAIAHLRLQALSLLDPG